MRQPLVPNHPNTVTPDTAHSQPPVIAGPPLRIVRLSSTRPSRRGTPSRCTRRIDRSRCPTGRKQTENGYPLFVTVLSRQREAPLSLGPAPHAVCPFPRKPYPIPQPQHALHRSMPDATPPSHPCLRPRRPRTRSLPRHGSACSQLICARWGFRIVEFSRWNHGSLGRESVSHSVRR